MTMHTLLDAFDAVSFSEQLHRRLESACAELSKKQGLREEKAWLETARLRVANAREGVGDLLTRVLRLPEMEPVREDQARILQGSVVDAVERLHAGITFSAGSRAPLIEALYGKLKLPVLRRCDREDFEKFCVDFEKRLNTSYAKRMFGDASFALVLPTLDQLRQAVATWRGVFSDVPLADQDAQGLRDELDAAARKLELPCRQARLLAEAALSPLRELMEISGVSQKPRRRNKALSEMDEHEMLDEDAIDPAAPSADELKELAATQPAPVDDTIEAALTKAAARGRPAAPVEPEPTAETEAAAPAEAEVPAETAEAAAPPAEPPMEVVPRRGKKNKPVEA